MKKILFLAIIFSLLIIPLGTYAVDCWDYSDETNCEAGDCYWESTSGGGEGWCTEKGCWNLYSETDCNNATNIISESCNWQSRNDGWCVMADCWNFQGTNETFCETNPFNLDCEWQGECHGWGECWSITNSTTCGETQGCTWGNCFTQDCWSYTEQSTCIVGTGYNGEACVWNGGMCIEDNCHRYANSTVCNADSDCTWDSEGDWCDENGCWEDDGDQTSCEANHDCYWQDPWCMEKGCWDYGNSSACGDDSNCYWDLSDDAWCESPMCWTYDMTNESACVNNSYNLDCAWNDQWCYPDFSDINCTTMTNEKDCFDTYFCWWDFGAEECNDPDGGFVDIRNEWNPGCWVFNSNQTTCEAISGCSWSSGACGSNSTIETDGLTCEYINDSTLCNELPVLSTCCNWEGSGCSTNRFSNVCWDDMEQPPEGAMFCEDFNAFTSESLCDQIADHPWYMPCAWDNSTDHCEFNAGDAFGGSGEFDKIVNKKSCEFAGGKWIQEYYCEGNQSVPTGRCEYKFDEETNCNRACFACEYQSDGSAWDTANDAEDACDTSALGFCDFVTDSNSPNGFGFCEPRDEFVDGNFGGCDSDCGSCTYMGDISQGEPQDACRDSNANCKWVADPLDVDQGQCLDASERTCGQQCDKCYSEEACANNGDGGDGACTWDTAVFICKSAGGSSEICFDGVDNDGDDMIDCGDSGCFSDPNCGGGFFGVDCFGYDDSTSCTGTTGCVWLTDEEECDMAGAECWTYDGNESACDAEANCAYQTGFGGGFCKIPDSVEDTCIALDGNETACNAQSNCDWQTDPWCEDHPTDEWCAGANDGWCDFVGFTCWRNQNESACTTNAFCTWTDDEYMYSGGMCDNACMAQDNSTSCTNTAINGTSCEWMSGMCNPIGFGGGPAGGGFGMECFQYDGNQTSCENQTGCSWFAESNAFCEVDHSSNCPQYTTSGACDAITECEWNGDWCDEKPFTCFNNPTLNSDADACTANQYCTWINDSYGSRCEPACFNSTASVDQNACDAVEGCRWTSGWCDPAMAGNMFYGGMIKFDGVVDLGTDSDSDASQDSIDIIGFGMKDMGDSYGFGIRVDDFKGATTCNGEKLSYGGVGNGNDTVKGFFYLDTDGATGNDCSLKHDSTKTGYEFFFKYIAEQGTDGEASETITSYRCIDGEWGVSDIKVSSDEDIMCSEVGGIAIGVDKDDLNKFPDLYSATNDFRVAVATAGASGNSTSPDDTASAGYGTPGAIDFQHECCWDKGADCDSDGITSESDPDCEKINKKGFIQFEDCFDNDIDEDGDGLTDCDDYECKDFKYCVDNQLGLNAVGYTDTTAPRVESIKVEKYPDGALIMYDTNEPASGLLYYYANDSDCATTDGLYYDIGWNSSNIKKYKTWHYASLGETTGLSEDTQYYYKVKVCDEDDNCGISACLDFNTTNTVDCGVCDFVAKIKAPSEWSVYFDMNQNGTYIKPGEGCSNTKAGIKTNYTDGRAVNVKLTKNDSITEIRFFDTKVTKTALSDKVRTIDSAGDVISGTSSAGIGYGGLAHETKDKIISNLHPQECHVKIPGNGACDALWHCDDNLENCADRTTDATLNETGANYCIWEIPYCEFSVWAGGDLGASSSSSAAASSSSSSGGGSSSSPTSASSTIGSVSAGGEAAFSFNRDGVNVEGITFTTNTALSGAKVTITTMSEATVTATSSVPIAGKAGKIFQYLNINTENFDATAIDGTASVEFFVAKSWLTANEIDKENVALFRLSDEWSQLETTIVSENDNNVKYSAVTPGFSYFAIGEKLSVVQTTDVVDETGGDGSEAGDVSGSEGEAAGPGTSGVIVAIVIVVLILLIAFFAFGKKKRR